MKFGTAELIINLVGIVKVETMFWIEFGNYVWISLTKEEIVFVKKKGNFDPFYHCCFEGGPGEKD